MTVMAGEQNCFVMHEAGYACVGGVEAWSSCMAVLVAAAFWPSGDLC